MSSPRRFVPVIPPPDFAHWQYRGGSIEITALRYIFGQHRVQVTWCRDHVMGDVLRPEF